MEKWKSGRNSIWEVNINATDVNNKLVKLLQESEKKLVSHYSQMVLLEKKLETAKKEITCKISENTKLKRDCWVQQKMILRNCKTICKILQDIKCNKLTQKCCNPPKKASKRPSHDQESVDQNVSAQIFQCYPANSNGLVKRNWVRTLVKLCHSWRKME